MRREGSFGAPPPGAEWALPAGMGRPVFTEEPPRSALAPLSAASRGRCAPTAEGGRAGGREGAARCRQGKGQRLRAVSPPLCAPGCSGSSNELSLPSRPGWG